MPELVPTLDRLAGQLDSAAAPDRRHRCGAAGRATSSTRSGPRGRASSGIG
ncbi:hypothetical protein [Streptomyces sp. NPDC001380]|uniref:hypothetical protein n=1 Tax=Streptomyces sp. NPDC001380 TaxID=3364566 RepID=UPI0036AE4C7D